MIGMSGKERAMGIALSDLIETMGRAVQNANTAVEQAAAAAYLGQGYEMRDTGDGSKAYVPVCYTIQIPSAPDEKQIQVPVTALLHAVAVVKSGAFAVMRLTYYCFNIEMLRGTWVHLAVMGIAMLSILYGSTMAVRETHFKRRLAFSTVSNLSYILLGVTMMSPLGLLAGISHLIFHAVMKIGAFFCAGAVLHQSGREYVDELNGLGRKMPLVFGTFVIFGLSLTGIPLFAGFISKWNIAQAAMDTGRAYPFAYAAVAVLLYSALMTGLYTLTTAVRAWFPDREPEAKNNAVSITDPNWEMKLPLGIFATVIVGLGLFSEPLMEILRSVAWGRF